jgi:hypothetical protein
VLVEFNRCLHLSDEVQAMGFEVLHIQYPPADRMFINMIETF